MFVFSHSLALQVVFPALLLFQLLRFPLGVLPNQLSSLADRLDAFLRLSEVEVHLTECLTDIQHGFDSIQASPGQHIDTA